MVKHKRPTYLWQTIGEAAEYSDVDECWEVDECWGALNENRGDEKKFGNPPQVDGVFWMKNLLTEELFLEE